MILFDNDILVIIKYEFFIEKLASQKTGILACFFLSIKCNGAVALFEKWRRTDRQIAIHEQVFLEYEHIITDARRFTKPLSMAEAINRVWFWTSQERVKVIYNTEDSFGRAQVWLSQFRLGRNRIIDTTLQLLTQKRVLRNCGQQTELTLKFSICLICQSIENSDKSKVKFPTN